MDERREEQKKLVYDLVCSEAYVPMKAKELAVLLQVPKDRRGELREVLNSLAAEGKICLQGNGKYTRGEAQRLAGIYRSSQRGFGFVAAEETGEEVFIPENGVGDAFHGDSVEIVITKTGSGKRREGKIVRILSRGTLRVVGRYQVKGKKSYGFVIPDDPRIPADIFVPAGKAGGAVDGHKVVAELTSYGGRQEKPEGKIVEILGHVNDPGVDILSIIRTYDLPEEFPERVMNQAARVPDAVSLADMAGRKDLRHLLTVTIDGEDAKDLDDAVTISRTDDGAYLLGVHIADVSNYVQERSALDREALSRGTSVYLADRVIPMLPHRLSNGICSLNAGEDRLALSCIMKVDEKGLVADHEICETVIRVDERMSYTSVKKILEDQDEEEIRKYESLVPMFRLMEELSSLIRNRRYRRGAIDFDFPESRLVLDEDGRPLEIRPSERNTATKIIEDFMLLANETVAEVYFWREIPFLYRVHETPDGDKLKKLAVFVNNFGYSMHVGINEVRPKEIQKLLGKIEGSPYETLISRLALRSMSRARYTPDNDGHFGLAARYYTHFTSPIRRYPDLQIHRIIKDDLRGRMNEKKAEHYRNLLPEVARQTSGAERRVEEAERETVKLKKAQYMSEKIGRVYEGVISGVTPWGIYVELPNTVEGLVHVANMRGDHYEYLEDRYELAGVRGGRRYRLGETVHVRVAGTDLLTRTIDFELADEGDMEDGEE